jgi:hypothetical protein
MQEEEKSKVENSKVNRNNEGSQFLNYGKATGVDGITAIAYLDMVVAVSRVGYTE